MRSEITYRDTTPADLPAILALYPQAFPDEDLTHVVTALLTDRHDVLSIAGFDWETLVAHVLFTACTLDPDGPKVALLGPLGVSPNHQKQGIGSEIVHRGLDRLRTLGFASVFVLGDPGYYGRFGFDADHDVSTPCPIPDDWASAWQSLSLSPKGGALCGTLQAPAPWMDPALWTP